MSTAHTFSAFVRKFCLVLKVLITTPRSCRSRRLLRLTSCSKIVPNTFSIDIHAPDLPQALIHPGFRDAARTLGVEGMRFVPVMQ